MTDSHLSCASRFWVRGVGVQSASPYQASLFGAYSFSREIVFRYEPRARRQNLRIRGLPPRCCEASALMVSSGEPVHLPSRAFDVLLFMVERPGEMLEKQAFMDAIWPRSVVEESSLTQCIFALRRALGDTATEHRFIATIPGRGYQFVAQVRESSPVIATPEIARPRSRRRLYAGAGLALMVGLLIAFRFWPPSAPDQCHRCRARTAGSQHRGDAVRRSELHRRHGVFRRWPRGRTRQ